VHNLGEEEIITEPTYEEAGVSRRLCPDCGKYVYEVLPVKEKIVIESVIEAEDYVPASASGNTVAETGEKKSGKAGVVIAVVAGVCICGGGAFALIKRNSAKSASRRRRRSGHSERSGRSGSGRRRR